MRQTLTIFTSAIVLSLFAVTPTYAQFGGSGTFSNNATGGSNFFAGVNDVSVNDTFHDSRYRQNLIAKKHIKTLKTGVKALESGEFQTADIIFAKLERKVKSSNDRTNLTPTLKYFRGVTQYGLGNNAEAAKLFKKATTLDENNEFYEAHAALGAMYTFSGRINDAKEVLNTLKVHAQRCDIICEDYTRINKAVKRLEVTIVEKS